MEFVGRGRGNYEKQQRTHVDGYRCRPKNTQNIAKLRCLPQNQSGTDDDIFGDLGDSSCLFSSVGAGNLVCNETIGEPTC